MVLEITELIAVRGQHRDCSGRDRMGAEIAWGEICRKDCVDQRLSDPRPSDVDWM